MKERERERKEGKERKEGRPRHPKKSFMNILQPTLSPPC
jgi:hypothetical protein